MPPRPTKGCDHDVDAVCSLCFYLATDERERARRNLAVMRQLAADGRNRRKTDLAAFHSDAQALRTEYSTAPAWYVHLFGTDATVDGRDFINPYSEFA